MAYKIPETPKIKLLSTIKKQRGIVANYSRVNTPKQIRSLINKKELSPEVKVENGKLLFKPLAKSIGVHSFPGKIRDSQTYQENTPGLFTQSIKGMKGKKFIESALDATIKEYFK